MVSAACRPRAAVLVVEDEPLLLLDAMDMIEDAGFLAHGAANADEALRLLQTLEGIAVLFTDIDLPGRMDGLALARVVRARWPAIAIMVTSGHVGIDAVELPERSQFLPKPYPPCAIEQALRAATP